MDNYNLTKYERETIINFNDGEGLANIYTCNKSLIKKLDGYCEKSSLISKENEDEYSKTYNLPKKYISIRFPKEISREKRAELAQIAKARFHSS